MLSPVDALRHSGPVRAARVKRGLPDNLPCRRRIGMLDEARKARQ